MRRFFARTTVLAFVGCASLAPMMSGCAGEEAKTALNYTADAKRAYEAAMVEFDGHNWIEATAMMREVKRKYSYSKYARLAELRIADADYAQDKFAEAIREYRQFVHDHRSDDEDVAYARSRIAEGQYAQISDSVLLASGEERDQAVILDAYKELRGFLHDYPNAKESPRMRKLLGEITGRLVKHELYVARFYLHRDNYDAAVLRIQYALRNFAVGLEGGPAESMVGASSGLEPEALLLLGETYLKMHRWTQARAAFEKLLQKYADSGLIVPARGYLDYMRERGV